MTNEERVADVLSSLRGLRLKPSEQAACLAKRGLIAPDPPPRYRETPQRVKRTTIQHCIGDGVFALFYVTEHATPEQRAAVLAALNALPEEGETT